MRSRNVVAIFMLAVGLLTGCGASTETLTKKVRASIEETWAKNPDLKDARIKSFVLVHKGGTQYEGILGAEVDGGTLNLSVDVTYDGKAFIWKPSTVAATDSAGIEPSATSAEQQQARNIAEVEKAKAILTLPVDVMPGAIGADSDIVITSGKGLSSLLSILKIKDLSELTVDGEKINIGDMATEAYY